jgi:glycosyltransferase involved in cell wall biosynthesis
VRIVLVTGSFPPMACGVGDYTRHLAEALSARPDVQVTVVTSEEARGGDAPARYEVLPIVRAWQPDEFPAIAEVVRRVGPDVVHVQYPTLGYRGPLAARVPALLRAMGVRVVETWHESFPLYFPVRLPMVDRLAMGWPRGDVIVVRPRYLERHRPWFRALLARKRLHFIPNAPTVPRVELRDEERAAIRERHAGKGRALLAFFGFMFEHKGIEEILEIIDPARHHLVLVGRPDPADPYQAELLRRVEGPLAGSVSMTGFLPAERVGEILAAADAVVLPFRNGGGSWNTTIEAAVLQGTFVLTTSHERTGYDPERNVFCARPRDVAALRRGLESHLGARRRGPVRALGWPEIAERHLQVYRGAR